MVGQRAVATTVGFVFTAVGALGFIGGGFVVDLLALTMADSVLHLVVTLGLLVPGLRLDTRAPAHA